jgi:CRISPR-associated protein Csb1
MPEGKQDFSMNQFDDAWLSNESDVVALVVRQWLRPVEGEDAIIFPPTYPIEAKGAGYDIDRFEDGTSVCQIDSVGSQANRMEPIFKREKYKHLVPQIVIKSAEREISLLDAGHRAADAIVRFSTLGPKLYEAFLAYQKSGNAEPLAKIAPTSIVFGSWDSRATQAKLPRVVRSVIRAFNVKELHRSAQYSTIAGEILEGGEAKVAIEGAEAELGLAHVPAVRKHGGVQVLGEIRRDAALNLEAVRALADGTNKDSDATLRLRRYILGLALVAFTAPADSFLREGCHLVPDLKKPAVWKLIKRDGNGEEFALNAEQARKFATEAASTFGITRDPISATFDAETARVVLGLKKEERKKLLRQGPVTKQAVERMKK